MQLIVCALVQTPTQRLTGHAARVADPRSSFFAILAPLALPVRCDPILRDAFGHLAIGRFPHASLQHRVVKHGGLQTRVGCLLSQQNFSRIQLQPEEAFR